VRATDAASGNSASYSGRSSATATGDCQFVGQCYRGDERNARRASGIARQHRPKRLRGVLVEVRDSGPGLAPESVDRLFESFYTTKPGGLGMGLSICRSIIEAHDGRLWASANTPRGAVFQFTLPRSSVGEKHDR
jgi:signal transduction histidine kinase